MNGDAKSPGEETFAVPAAGGQGTGYGGQDTGSGGS